MQTLISTELKKKSIMKLVVKAFCLAIKDISSDLDTLWGVIIFIAATIATGGILTGFMLIETWAEHHNRLKIKQLL